MPRDLISQKLSLLRLRTFSKKVAFSTILRRMAHRDLCITLTLASAYHVSCIAFILIQYLLSILPIVGNWTGTLDWIGQIRSLFTESSNHAALCQAYPHLLIRMAVLDGAASSPPRLSTHLTGHAHMLVLLTLILFLFDLI